MTKNDIKRITALNSALKREREQLDYLKAKATTVPAIEYKERVQTSVKNDSNHYVDEAIDLEAEIADLQAELEELQEELKSKLKILNGRLARRIMELRYLKCLKWDEIADVLGYTVRRLQQIEESSIKKIVNS